MELKTAAKILNDHHGKCELASVDTRNDNMDYSAITKTSQQLLRLTFVLAPRSMVWSLFFFFLNQCLASMEMRVKKLTVKTME